MASALIYCQSGGGKTVNGTMVATREKGKNLLMCSDNSSIVLNNFKRDNLDIEKIQKWSGEDGLIVKFERAVATEKYDNIILDNITDIFDMAILELEESGRYKDMRQAYQVVYQTLKRLSRTAGNLKCDVLFTAWEITEEKTLSTGQIVNVTKPHLPKKITDNILGLCNVVGHVESALDNNGVRRWYYNYEGHVAMYGKDQIFNRKSGMPENIFRGEE